MRFRFLAIIALVLLEACQSGRIPCPEFRADRTRKSFPNRRAASNSERTTTASARELKPEQAATPVRPAINYYRGSEVKPALENIDVEEWDCPKPGTRKNMPKALRDNIRKNKKAYEAYYRSRADSLQSVQSKTELD